MVYVKDKNDFQKKSKFSSNDDENSFSNDEIKDKLKNEYHLNLPEIKKNAKRYCVKLNLTEEDLIQEAYQRLLNGSRSWRKDLDIIRVFNSTTRSIADGEFKKEKRDLFLDDTEGILLENTPDLTQNAEQRLIDKQKIEHTLNKFSNDKNLNKFAHMKVLGYARKEIMKELSLNPTEYNTLLKRFSRRIKKIK